MEDHSLGMREAPGSNPGGSITQFIYKGISYQIELKKNVNRKYKVFY